jgi:hypothetical protein
MSLYHGPSFGLVVLAHMEEVDVYCGGLKLKIGPKFMNSSWAQNQSSICSCRT